MPDPQKVINTCELELELLRCNLYAIYFIRLCVQFSGFCSVHRYVQLSPQSVFEHFCYFKKKPLFLLAIISYPILAT